MSNRDAVALRQTEPDNTYDIEQNHLWFRRPQNEVAKLLDLERSLKRKRELWSLENNVREVEAMNLQIKAFVSDLFTSSVAIFIECSYFSPCFPGFIYRMESIGKQPLIAWIIFQFPYLDHGSAHLSILLPLILLEAQHIGNMSGHCGPTNQFF